MTAGSHGDWQCPLQQAGLPPCATSVPMPLPRAAAAAATHLQGHNSLSRSSSPLTPTSHSYPPPFRSSPLPAGTRGKCQLSQQERPHGQHPFSSEDCANMVPHAQDLGLPAGPPGIVSRGLALFTAPGTVSMHGSNGGGVVAWGSCSKHSGSGAADGSSVHDGSCGQARRTHQHRKQQRGGLPHFVSTSSIIMKHDLPAGIRLQQAPPTRQQPPQQQQQTCKDQQQASIPLQQAFASPKQRESTPRQRESTPHQRVSTPQQQQMDWLGAAQREFITGRGDGDLLVLQSPQQRRQQHRQQQLGNTGADMDKVPTLPLRHSSWDEQRCGSAGSHEADLGGVRGVKSCGHLSSVRQQDSDDGLPSLSALPPLRTEVPSPLPPKCYGVGALPTADSFDWSGSTRVVEELPPGSTLAASWREGEGMCASPKPRGCCPRAGQLYHASPKLLGGAPGAGRETGLSPSKPLCRSGRESKGLDVGAFGPIAAASLGNKADLPDDPWDVGPWDLRHHSSPAHLAHSDALHNGHPHSTPAAELMAAATSEVQRESPHGVAVTADSVEPIPWQHHHPDQEHHPRQRLHPSSAMAHLSSTSGFAWLQRQRSVRFPPNSSKGGAAGSGFRGGGGSGNLGGSSGKGGSGGRGSGSKARGRPARGADGRFVSKKGGSGGGGGGGSNPTSGGTPALEHPSKDPPSGHQASRATPSMGPGNTATSSPCSPLRSSAQPTPRPAQLQGSHDMMDSRFGGFPPALQPGAAGTSEGQEPNMLSDKSANTTIRRDEDSMLCSDDESDCLLLGHLSYPAPSPAPPCSPLVLPSPSSIANKSPAPCVKVHSGGCSGRGGRDDIRGLFLSGCAPSHCSNSPTHGKGTFLSHQLLTSFSGPHGGHDNDSPGVLRFSEGGMSSDQLAGLYLPSASPTSGRVNNGFFVVPYDAPPARPGSPLIDAPGWLLPGSLPPGGPAIAPFMDHLALI